MSDRDLLLLQLALQRIAVDADGRLSRLPGPNPDGLPRYYRARLADGSDLAFYGLDLSAALRDQLAALTWEQARADPARVCGILAQQRPCDGVWIGRSYVVARPIRDDERAGVRRLDPSVPAERALLEAFDADVASYGWPAYAVLHGGRVVSACVSSREDARAAEAWVQADPEHRGRGYARRVTAAWAQAAQLAGKAPFYSHSDDNVASAGVARSLGLTTYVFDAGYL